MPSIRRNIFLLLHLVTQLHYFHVLVRQLQSRGLKQDSPGTQLWSDLCPVKALQKLFQGVHVSLSAPAFSYISKAQRPDRLTISTLKCSIQSLASRIGLEPAKYSGHSLRRRGATFAFQCGIPAEFIKMQGDWRSDAYLLYLLIPLVDRLISSQTFAYHVGIIV